MGNFKNFPFEIKSPQKEIYDKYPDIAEDLLFVAPKNYCLPKAYEGLAETLYTFKARPSDIWIYGYPRSGTTLAQEIVWLLANNLDYTKAGETIMDLRFPVYEGAIYWTRQRTQINSDLENRDAQTAEIGQKWVRPKWETLAETEDPRFIKTHLPFSLGPSNLLTSGAKIIYCARNPKNVTISHFHFNEIFGNLHSELTFEKFWDLFRNGLVWNTPYFEHLKEGWDLRDHPNVLYLSYDTSIKDIKATIRDIAQFLGKEISGVEVDKLAEHVRIDNFRKNKSVNNAHLKDLKVMAGGEENFIRKGGVGGWGEYFKNGEVDEWIAENLKGSNIQF